VVGILPSGRSLAHSLLFALLLGVVVWVVARRRDHVTAGIAFLFGHVLHIVTDAIPAALAGRWAELGFLFWPVTPAYRYPGDSGRDIPEYLFGHLTTEPHFQLGLFVFAVALWLYDGWPGLDAVHPRDNR
jgi:hypothetical protein